MGAFKERAILLEGIKCGTIGVLLDDESRPPKLWEVWTIWADGELSLIEPRSYWKEDVKTANCYPEDFWPLLDVETV